MGQRIPLTRTKVASGVSRGALRRLKLPFWLFCRATHFAPDHHLDFWARQPIQRQDGAQQKKISDEWAFVPLQQAIAVPGGRKPLLSQFLQRHFGRTTGMQPLSSRSWPLTRGDLRVNPTTWTRTLRLSIHFEQGPDFGIAWYLGQIP